MRGAILTGRDKAATREAVVSGLASGEIQIVVGTHALVQEDVAFDDLALAVVDEQHRFGVHQRLSLAAKGRAADMLVMTATPIPRTLMMTAYGDLDVSRLIDKPAGRQPIDTRALPVERLDEVIAGLRRAVAAGARAYWVCPLVDESEVVDLAAAEQRYAEMAEMFPGKVGLVHGRHERPGAGRRDGRIRRRQAAGPGGDDRDRGRRRCAGGDRHDHRACGALRSGAIASAARACRPRAGAFVLPAALSGSAGRNREGAAQHPARDRRRIPHRRGGSAPARRGRTAGHAAERPAGVQARGLSRSMANCWRRRGTIPG